MGIDFLLKSVLRTTAVHLRKLDKIGIKTVRDLLENFPRAIESSEISSKLTDIRLGEKNTFAGKLCDIRREKTPRGKTIGRAAFVLSDGTTLEVVWFQIPYLLKNIKDETSLFLVGKVVRDYGKIQIQNPEVHLEKNVHVGGIRAIYPESEPLTSKWFREKIAGVLLFASEFPEILPEEILQEKKFLKKPDAIKQIHHPDSIHSWDEARRRLAFEEVFEIQVRVLREKFLREKEHKNPFKIIFDVEAVKSDIARLPFELTIAQKKVLFQILKDFERDRPAHRLVQGDVGSGKTIVAFLAAAEVARAGNQVAILSPTEILAGQHFANAQKFFPPEMKVELLTGSTKTKKKQEIKSQLKSGEIKILIGTHAILTEDTEFQKLGLAVIDEQHRFGVVQRSVLAQNHAHTVAMTATPIPRTLALTIYGDQDISVIDELPPGRKQIITRLVADEKTRSLMHHFIDDQIGKSRQVFWVCPLIDESDKIEARNVKVEFERIATQIFPNRKVEFLHGKMKPKEKDAVMDRFKKKEFDILVSTSVIEVGVDIPDATVMVIENSERFGLAQLHQFRGRIGRNEMQSYCFLMTESEGTSATPASESAKSRLRAMEKHHSGQALAEIDLKLRGMGEIYGTRQSGLPDFKCANLSDVEMLQDARDWAIKILKDDLELTKYPALKKKVSGETVYF